MPHETHGTRSTPATLDAIDATVDGLCACGCGQQLLADGPSAWFVDGVHQAAWALRGTTDPAQVLLAPDATDEGQVFVRQEEWGQVWQEVGRLVEQVMAGTFLNGDAGRGLIATVPVATEPTTAVDIYEQLMCLHRQLSASPYTPRIRMLHCGRSVIDSLHERAVSAAGSAVPLGPLGYLLGIPIVPDTSLPDDGWRLLDAQGNVVAEGRVRG